MKQEIIQKYKTGEYQQCYDLCSDLLESNPNDFEVLSYKGACELKLNRFTEAIETFTKCLSINEGGFHIWTFRGDAFYELGEYDKSFNDYWYSLQIEPDNGAVMDKCARSLFRIGNRQYALEYISKAVSKAESPEPFIVMATMLEAIGESDEADKIRKKANQLFPNNF